MQNVYKLNVFIYNDFSYNEGRKNHCVVLVQMKSEIHVFHKHIK